MGKSNAKPALQKGQEVLKPVDECSSDFNFYKLAEYYDMAMERNTALEIDFFRRMFDEFSDRPVTRILEIACGTGLFLEWLPRFGYFAAGYDLSPDMVEFARERLDRNGFRPEKAEVYLGDMKNFRLDEKFDAAFNLVNAVGYINTDEDIINHFKVTADSLNDGCLYIIEVGLQCNDFENEKTPDETWHVKKDGIEIECTWQPHDYNVPNKIRHILVEMKINDHGSCTNFSEMHSLRLWTHEDLVALGIEGGFEVMGVYFENFNSVPDNQCITGDLGGLYYVLKKKKNPA